MHGSVTLEMDVRLLTGLKLGKLNSNPSFLSKGLTTAVFHSLQNSPLPREMLTILVISVITFGSIFFNITVGIASSSQRSNYFTNLGFSERCEPLQLRHI